MIEKTYIDLINKEIDGVNSQEDSDKLKAYIAQNPEAQDLYDELLSMSTMLDKIYKIEPSPTLKKDILDSIPLKKYATKEKKDLFEGTRNLLKSLVPTTPLNFNFRYAYAFSAGLIVGITVFFLVIDRTYQNTRVDISDLYGTMILHETSGNLEPAEHVEINLDQVYGKISIMYSKDIVLADVDLKTQQESEIVFEFNEDDISFSGFMRLSSDEINMNASEDYVKLSNIRDHMYVIIFDNKTESVTPMNFKIFSSGDMIYEKVITTGQKSE